DPDIHRPELLGAFQHRSRLFLESFAHYFSDTASHPAFGRSLIYRCALVSAAIVGIWKDFSPLSAGLTRRLCSQSLKYFWERGLIADDGSIPLGWTGRFEAVAEKYSGPASPLWLNKVFAAFLMPADHPFWTAPEEPLPVEKGNYCITHKVPGFLVQGHQGTGHIQLINQGSDSYVNAPTDWKTQASDSLYLKFAYSSHFPNDVGPTQDGLVCGNMISLCEEQRGFSHRERIYPVHISDRVAVATHYPFGESYGSKRDSLIETAVILKDDHQIRAHWVISPNRPIVYEGGYSLPYTGEPPRVLEGKNWICIQTAAGSSCVRALLGYDEVGTSRSSGTNPLGKQSCMPFMKSSQPVVAQGFYICEVLARPMDFNPEQELQLLTSCTLAGRKVTLTFNDGEAVAVKLGAVEAGEEKVGWIKK
ncbi:MAG: DUF2264 domain-containing protein, partial [Fidelibacterota bacterium]